MSTQSRMSRHQLSADTKDSAPVRTPAAKNQKLSVRLLDMSEPKLRAYQTSATRIAGDPKHLRHSAASRAVPQIEAEILRRSALRESLG